MIGLSLMRNSPKETFPLIYHPDKGYAAMLKIRYAGKSYVLTVPKSLAHCVGWNLGDRLVMQYGPREFHGIRLVRSEDGEAFRSSGSFLGGGIIYLRLRKVGNSLSFTLPKLVAKQLRWKPGDPVVVQFDNGELIITSPEDFYLRPVKKWEKACA